MAAHKISTVIITLNEEATIERCIKSVLDISDEILVLDSHSTDSTQDICEQFEKVTFIPTDWLGYSQTKNKGAELAKHSVVLSIDADECLDSQALDAITANKLNGLHGVYSINRKNYFGEKWIKYGGWYPDVKTRLFDKSLAQWSGDFVHETLEIIDGAEEQHLNGNIEHFTVRNKAHHLETIRKYARLAAQRDLASGKKMNVVKACTSALVHFVKIYIFKLGMLHGSTGLWIAINSGKSKWLRYKYAMELKA